MWKEWHVTCRGLQSLPHKSVKQEDECRFVTSGFGLAVQEKDLVPHDLCFLSDASGLTTCLIPSLWHMLVTASWSLQMSVVRGQDLPTYCLSLSALLDSLDYQLFPPSKLAIFYYSRAYKSHQCRMEKNLPLVFSIDQSGKKPLKLFHVREGVGYVWH